jgi:hypothetical protein
MAVTNTQYGSDFLLDNWCTTNFCGFYTITALPINITMLANGTYTTNISMNWVFYNLTNMRILWEIGSDGLDSSNNYTASSQASTDKSVYNLKNDIIEKYWESTDNINQWIQFDAGVNKAIYIDTLALLAHTLSSSAQLVLKGYGSGSDSAITDWSNIPVYANIAMGTNPNDDRVIWVSPTQPTTRYRHWRLEISDGANANSYLRIGRFIAGSSLVFNGENLLANLRYGKQNYKDEIRLNGFSSVFNNRALKRNLSLSLNELNIQQYSNTNQLNKYIDYCRDSLKALVIIDPQNPYKYSVFAKLSSMPAQEINYVDAQNEYATISLSYDEGI